MHFKEIIIQGLFGVAKGVRLPLSAGLCEPLLPPPLDAAIFKKIVALLLYPHDALHSAGIHVDTSVPYPVRLGGVLDIGGLDYKLIWDLKEDTLQVVSGDRTVATGREQAQALWEKLCGLLPFRFAAAIHHHDFFASNSSDVPVGSDDKTAELVGEYRRSLTIEGLENQIGSIEAELHELEHSSDPAVKVEVGLDRVIKRLGGYSGLPELEDKDREFLEGFDARSTAMRSELEDVVHNLHANEGKRARSAPRALMRDSIFWLGILLGVGCMIAALVLQTRDPRFRAVALGNAVGFGLTLGVTLRRIGQHERLAHVESHGSALEARREDLEKSMEREGLRLKRLKQRFGDAGSAEQILEDVDERDKLVDKRRELERRLKAHLSDPEFLARREHIKKLRDKKAALQEQRDTFGQFVMPTYELRSELEKRGIAVDALLPMGVSPDAPLLECARQLELIPPGDTIEAGSLGPFNELLNPVLGKPAARVSLEDGAITITDGERKTRLSELDERRQKPWLRAMALGLIDAHQRTRRAAGDHISLLVLSDPWRGLQRNERVRLYSVLKDMARHFQVVLPKAGE